VPRLRRVFDYQDMTEAWPMEVVERLPRCQPAVENFER